MCRDRGVERERVGTEFGGRAGCPPAAKQACGQDINYDSTNDASGVLKTLPASLQSHFTSWPNPVATTPWSTFKGVKGPWKIGLIMYAPRCSVGR